MAYRGSALSSIAQIKEQIMLTGGVLTSVAMGVGSDETFRGYNGRAGSGVYDRRDITVDEPVDMHALFCYG
jgi:hypothetical protein